MLHSRVAQLVADCGVEVESQHPMEKVLELSEMLTRQEARHRPPRGNPPPFAQAPPCCGAKGEEAIARLHQRRKQLLRQCGAESEEHLHRLAAEAARVENLRREHEQLHRRSGGNHRCAGIAGRLESNISRVPPPRISTPAATTCGPGLAGIEKRDSSADRKTRPAYGRR